jgi:CubicO group peptidase (beta-lactamase class C family)
MLKRFLILFFVFSFIDLSGQNINLQLQNIFEDHELMGMSAVAVYNDSIIYSGNFGKADYARNIPVTDSTLFRIASISKTVAATALMILYEKGYFQLDEDIGNILGYKVRNPDFPNVAITPRMLLSHTSSIQDCIGYYNLMTDAYKYNPPPSLSRLLTDTGYYHTSDLWQNKMPGTYFMYSNLNFGIIGTMVEKLSGECFDNFCMNHIFYPLKIAGSYNVQDVSNMNNVAVLYRAYAGKWYPQADNFHGTKPQPRNLDEYVAGNNGIIFSPHAGLHISATDLARFMMMHINGGIYRGVRILQDSTVRLMHSPQWIFNGNNGDNYYGLFRSWGLGFQLTTNTKNMDNIASQYILNGHIGESYGLVSDMFFNSDNKFGMIFMTNGSAEPFECSNSSAFYAVEDEVMRSLFEMVIQPKLENYVVSSTGNKYKTGLVLNKMGNHFYMRYYLSSAGVVHCSVFNYIGQQVSGFNKNFNSYGREQLSIDTKGLANGLYFCVIEADGNTTIQRFQINR